jgi:glycosyltransferase involved in cell wall biosynthesis
MVLAYNEERHIRACLDSIYAADAAQRFEVFVMANGCTDRTGEIVLEYARTQPLVHLVTITLGDKCNAWNVFIHETVPAHSPGREAYFFMDGDATVVPGSFSAMMRGLQSHPHAHAAAAVPASGRNVERDRNEILDNHGLVANLYALRGSYVNRLQRLSVRIPLGLEGDDGLIGALTKWDLAPDTNGFDEDRIVPCADAAFAFEPISPFRLSDWRVYWKRAVRYGRRRYEFELLGPRLKERGIAGLPAHIAEIYTGADALRLRWQGLYTITNLVALRDMRRIGNARRAAEAGRGGSRVSGRGSFP